MVRIALLAVALIWALVTLNATIERAIGAASCAVRAEFEQVSCISPPEAWRLSVLLAVIVGLSVVIGRELTLWARSEPFGSSDDISIVKEETN